MFETPHTTTKTKKQKNWHQNQLLSNSEGSESENEVVPIKKSKLETTNNDNMHLTTIQRVLASQIENLELKNKDKLAECELYRLKTVQLQQQLEDLKDKTIIKPSEPLLFKATSSLVEEESHSFSDRSSLNSNVIPEIIYRASYKDFFSMANFVNYLDHLQTVELTSGAVKVIPPPEWLAEVAEHNYGENSKLFDHHKVLPKVQCSKKLVDGIFLLANNPLRDVQEKSQIQLRVRMDF